MKLNYLWLLMTACATILASCAKQEVLDSKKTLSASEIELQSHLKYFFPLNGNGIEEINDTLYNAHGTPFMKDRFGNSNAALCLDGTRNYMDFSHTMVTKKGTISFWVKIAPQQFGTTIISNYYPESAIGVISSIGISETGKFITQTQLKYYSFESINPAPINTWVHVVLRWDDATEKIDFFVNNVREISENYNSYTPGNDVVDERYINAVTSEIGRTAHYPGSHEPDEYFYFKGLVDEIKVFDIAISDEEVAELFNEAD